MLAFPLNVHDEISSVQAGSAAVAAAFLFLYLEGTDLQHPAYVSDHALLAALQTTTHVHCSITISIPSSSTF
jgi:hypothetical protein